jgi:hypothetical protein
VFPNCLIGKAFTAVNQRVYDEYADKVRQKIGNQHFIFQMAQLAFCHDRDPPYGK